MGKKKENRNLKKLSRADLLEILIKQSEEIDRLTAELYQKESDLQNINIKIGKAGSIAEAALQVSGVFEAAQKACDIYIENTRRLNDSQQTRCMDMDKETMEKCDKMLAETKEYVDKFWHQAIIQFDKEIKKTPEEGKEL